MRRKLRVGREKFWTSEKQSSLGREAPRGRAEDGVGTPEQEEREGAILGRDSREEAVGQAEQRGVLKEGFGGTGVGKKTRRTDPY